MTENHEIIEAEATDTELAVVTDQSITLSSGGMSLPSVEHQATILAEYDKRKKFFLSWLKEHFQPGVHYGVPPGCEPRNTDSDQWRNKPSLYDAGARLFMDIFGLKATYEADMDAWEMLGKKAECYCRLCKLTMADGSPAGQGAGAFRVNEKKMQENAALKMADKRARVAAVLDACPFARELFTQDLEDIGSPLDKLKEWILGSRIDFEDELSTDDFLANVAEACLYGKRTITNKAEAARIQDSLAAGDFDLRTGERIASGEAAPASDPEPAPDPPAKITAKSVKARWWKLAQAAAKDTPDQWPDLKDNAAKWFIAFAESVLGETVEAIEHLGPEELVAVMDDMDRHGDPLPLSDRDQ